MIRLRPYKEFDAETIVKWIKDQDTYLKWGGKLFGEFPISPDIINEKYTQKNGDCKEPDNFYPWIAFDDENGVVGHFIMRYLHGNNRILRFGWVIVDDSIRGKGYGTRMLKAGLKYAFEILDADIVTIGVFESNPLAHRCYQRAGFADRKIIREEPWNIIEMEIGKSDYIARKCQES